MTTDTDKPTGDHAELVALLRIQAAFPQDPRHRAVTLKAADALEAQGKKIAELERNLAAANAKLAVLQAPQDVARLVKELTDKKTLLANGHDMSFYRYREDEVRPKAADALLSQAAQLAEKEEHLSQTLDQLQRHMNWDSAEWDRQLLALKRQLTEKEAECEMKLPCGVKLDSGTHIGKGCALSTLIVALKARAKYKADAARQP